MGIKRNSLFVTSLIRCSVFHSYYFATPPCFGSCNHVVSSIVICIPSFVLMSKQLNKASWLVAHFTGRSQFPSKNLQNSNKKIFC